MSARETRGGRQNEMIKEKQTNRTQEKKEEQERTTKAKETFLSLFYKNFCNIYETCKSVNICRSTYYDWMEKDEEFKKSVSELQEGLIDMSESQLLKLIESKHPTAIIFHLKTKGKERGYVETIAIGGDEKRPVRLILEEDNSNSPAKGNDKNNQGEEK